MITNLATTKNLDLSRRILTVPKVVQVLELVILALDPNSALKCPIATDQRTVDLSTYRLIKARLFG